jgi:hypothetical protein
VVTAAFFVGADRGVKSVSVGGWLARRDIDVGRDRTNSDALATLV